MQSPFKINFTNITEVRMGSPYNTCQIELIGFDEVRLAKYDWQDKFAWTNDYGKLVLIKYNYEKKIPGFHFFVINVKTGETKESERYFGLINTISIVDNKIVINKFLYDKSKSNPPK